MCMVGDEDYWEFYNEYTPKAKVEHTCGECGRTIAKGEKYRTQGGKSDGYFEWHKTCTHCDAASEWLMSACDGYIFGRRQEDFLSHVTGEEKYLRTRPLTRLVRWLAADWKAKDGTLRPLDDVVALTSDAIRAYHEQRDREIAASQARRQAAGIQ